MTHTTSRLAQVHQPKGRDLTSGSLHRAIWYLAPAMMLETGVLNVAQVLDTYWVGQLGSAALAAVTISITMRWVLNSLANGLGIGGMAVVARRIGAKKGKPRTRRRGRPSCWDRCLAAAGGLGLAVAEPLLILLGAAPRFCPWRWPTCGLPWRHLYPGSQLCHQLYAARCGRGPVVDAGADSIHGDHGCAGAGADLGPGPCPSPGGCGLGLGLRVGLCEPAWSCR